MTETGAHVGAADTVEDAVLGCPRAAKLEVHALHDIPAPGPTPRHGANGLVTAGTANVRTIFRAGPS